MKESFTAIKVTDTVYWVGAVDWTVRDFHGYATSGGTTYNAYLVLADKVTLVDTVKAPFRDQLVSRISSVIDPSKIDYIISNHSEMDHSGCLPQMIEMIAPEKVVASRMGEKALGDHFHDGLDIVAVGDGDEIDLGNRKVVFLETRMLHWPDSMVSYLADEKLLFSQDAFGMHLASSERFDDEIAEWRLEREAAKYYANILLPFSHLVLKVLDRIGQLGLEFDMIAPDHGPIWRGNPGRIIELYRKWAGRELSTKVVVAYDTMWGSTEKMALATELLDAGGLIVGSPTMNNNIFPTMADLLVYLKGLKPTGLVGAAFGSYGWSGESIEQLEQGLGEMKVELVTESVKVKYVPDAKALGACRALGEAVAKRLV
jgi:flavorubredoxin